MEGDLTMTKCSICAFNQGGLDLCMNADKRLSGEGCEHFSAREKQVCVDSLCLICGGINDQEHKGYQYCSKCGKEL